MLVIQMPDSEERKKKDRDRRIRALGYLIPGLIITYCVLDSLAHGQRGSYAVLAVEAWWLWACWTDPGLKK